MKESRKTILHLLVCSWRLYLRNSCFKIQVVVVVWFRNLCQFWHSGESIAAGSRTICISYH